MVRVIGGHDLDNDPAQSWVDQQVSPAAVRMTTSISAKTAKGDTESASAFSMTAKSVARSSYATFRFTGGAAVANQRLVIQVSKKVGTKWTAFKYLSGVIADASGTAFYVFKPGATGTWRFRAYFAGSSTATKAYSLPRTITWY